MCFCPCDWCLEEEKSIDRYERSQKHARNHAKKKERKASPKMNETTLYVNVEDEHSVPDCVKQIKFEIAANKETQTEEVIRHTLSK